MFIDIRGLRLIIIGALIMFFAMLPWLISSDSNITIYCVYPEMIKSIDEIEMTDPRMPDDPISDLPAL